MNETRNLFLAIVLSVGVLLGFEYIFPKSPSPKALKPTEQVLKTTVENKSDDKISRTEAIQGSKRIAIKTDKLQGSINLKGAKLDDLSLLLYKENLEPDSPHVTLLNPLEATGGYLIETGWIGQNKDFFPGSETVWSSSSKELTINNPITLSWTNSAGILFEKKIEVDENYLFKVTDKITNLSSEAQSVISWARISRIGQPQTSDYMVLHEGLVGILNTKLQEITYSKLKEKNVFDFSKSNGWFGFTDKYWLTSLIVPENISVDAKFKYQNIDGQEIFQTEYRTEKTALNPKSSKEFTHRVFAGAKIVELLDAYEISEKIDRFDLAVDFGWFYFLTKPLFYVLKTFYNFFGNFGIAIIILTIIMKLLMFPVANKGFRSMNRMKLLQPEMEKFKTLYPDDKMKQQQAMMEFYKKEKINPLGGCLPIVIQIPVFFALYKVLFVSIEMRQAPFFGWIKDLSMPDPTSFANLFGLLNFTPPSFLMIGILPLLMGLSMWLQQKMSPRPQDETQAKLMLLMPVFVTYLFSSFPAGLVLYWTWSNILSIVQQYWQSKYESAK